MKTMHGVSYGGTVYQIFLPTFDENGTLKSAEKKLPEIANLGIEVVYLCPTTVHDDDTDVSHWSKRQEASGLANPKNPYRTSDWYGVDSQYGTEEDLCDFIKTAHKLGMKVILDIVFYHCGPKAVFLNEHPDFIVRDENGEPVCGEWRFPEMNFENENVREYLYGALVHMIKDYDCDGFRIDVGDYMPLSFWEEARKRCDKTGKDIFMLNEGSFVSFLKNAMDVNYHFPFHEGLFDAIYEHKTQKLFDAIKSESELTTPDTRLLRCIETHDVMNDSFAKYGKRIETLIGDDGFSLAMLACFTLRGMPFLFNGCEYADEAPMSMFSNRFYGKMHIDRSKGIGKRYEFLQKLIKMKKESTVLQFGDEKIKTDGDILYVTREYEGKKIYAVMNFGKDEKRINLPDGKICLSQNLVGNMLSENGFLLAM